MIIRRKRKIIKNNSGKESINSIEKKAPGFFEKKVETSSVSSKTFSELKPLKSLDDERIVDNDYIQAYARKRLKPYIKQGANKRKYTRLARKANPIQMVKTTQQESPMDPSKIYKRMKHRKELGEYNKRLSTVMNEINKKVGLPEWKLTDKEKGLY